MLTLASYPLFVLRYAMTLLAPRRIWYRYALGMVELSHGIVRSYQSEAIGKPGVGNRIERLIGGRQKNGWL